jgi:hypothetical protein
MERIFVVKHSFKATRRGNRGDSRLFKPAENVWWDPEQVSNPAVFKADRLQFEVDRAAFIRCVKSKPFPS